MVFQLNLEEMDGRWIAHVADLLGCFAAAATPEKAVAEASRAISDYWAWRLVWQGKMGDVFDTVALNATHLPPLTTPIEVVVREQQAAWLTADDTEINAFFAEDRRPLNAVEVNLARQLLWWTREDLLNSLLGLPPADYDRLAPGFTWTVNDILRHLGTGENWYLDRLGLASETAWDLPDVLGRLILVRQHLLEALPSWIDEPGTLTLNAETWSPRKVVRRALWHEREHLQQLLALRQTLLVKSS